MRPNLSDLENGAYGTPSRVVSLVTGGPQPSVEGSAETKSRREAGAMMIVGRKGLLEELL